MFCSIDIFCSTACFSVLQIILPKMFQVLSEFLLVKYCAKFDNNRPRYFTMSFIIDRVLWEPVYIG